MENNEKENEKTQSQEAKHRSTAPLSPRPTQRSELEMLRKERAALAPSFHLPPCLIPVTVSLVPVPKWRGEL